MTKKLWGGRFGKKTDPLVEEFTRSIQYDYKLALYDVAGSIAHVEILKKAGYLSSEEAANLVKGLRNIYLSLENGTFKFDRTCEDIHTDIQNILLRKIGKLALKLHTARSRNDQVAFATKLYCKDMIKETQKNIEILMSSIKKNAQKVKDMVIPGLTHLQHAQPVYLKDYFGAYIEMLKRDKNRLGYILENICPSLGAGALAGTPIASGKYNTGISVPVVNSLDSVSDRDFVLEILNALAILGMHLSRLAEDFIIWSTREFGFIEIDDAFCTGSSLMPQKKNPDTLELTRGYAGRLYGNLVSVLTMMKGLPLSYNRDMQLDKEPLFNSFEIVSGELRVLAGLIGRLKFDKAKIEERLKDESLYATDLVYYLIDKKMSFGEAHAVVGKLVKYSLDNSILIKDMPESLLREFCDKFVKDEIIKLFDPLVSVMSKKSVKR